MRERRDSGKGGSALSPTQGRGAAFVPASADLYCMHRCLRTTAEFGPTFLAEVLAAAGHPRSVLGYPLRSALEVLWGRGWALWTHPGSGGCSESAQIPVVKACDRGQRGRHSVQAEGRRAHAPTRAPHPGLLPMSPSACEPRTLRLESSSIAQPAHSSPHCIYQTARERVSPSP